MSEGWIKLHRKFTKWEWYDDINTCRVFLHCLLRANYKEKKWRGQIIPRGTFVTSYQNLSKGTGLTIQNVRTALKKLEDTGEINKQSTSVNTWLTVVNYDKYQETNKPLTNDQQTTNKRLTTTKNEKNIKKGKKEKNLPGPGEASEALGIARHLLEAITSYDPSHQYTRNPPTLTSKRWETEIDRAMRLDGRTPEQLRFIIDYVFTHDSRTADFWKPNIQSGKTLRKHFDRIKTQIITERKNDKKHRKQTNINGALDKLNKIDFEDSGPREG